MAVKDALLALLADGPQYGYQLKSAFDEATGSAWPLNIGQVYTTLQRLERDDLVEPDGAPDDDGRQPYLLTAKGREALNDWIDTPVGQVAASRDEVSMKVLIAVATGVAPALELVRGQRVAAMSGLQGLMAMKPEARSKGLAWQLHLDRTVLLAESEIRWLDLVEQRLEASGQTHEVTTPHARHTANPGTNPGTNPETNPKTNEGDQQ